MHKINKIQLLIVVSDWTNNYNNKKHGNKAIRDILHKEIITMFT
jgi:hypothetical protein